MNDAAVTLWRCHLAMGVLMLAGCGTTRSQTATEQLLMSDAVDRAITTIDFSPLAHQRIYFDTQYIVNIKGLGFVNSEYIVSSLRHQMVAANCRLQEKKEDADIIVEARVGALGTDSHDMVYGVPASNGLTSAASLLPNVPSIPVVPEISFAKRADQQGAAKVGVFAYHRETRKPIWTAGLSTARSKAKDTWLLGAGPFQSGTIYEATRFGGLELGFPTVPGISEEEVPEVLAKGGALLQPIAEASINDDAVQPASHAEAVPPPAAGAAATPAAPGGVAPGPTATAEKPVDGAPPQREGAKS